MDKFDRIQQLHRNFRNHRLPISVKQLSERMECSEKTIKRMIEVMRLHLDAPIEFDKQRRGYYYNEKESDRFELPGLWLTSTELQSLSLLLSLLEDIGSGLLNQELKPIEKEIDKLLAVHNIPPNEFRARVKVLPVGNRQLRSQHFEAISTALLQGHQISIRYSSYANDQSQRTISPQTLIYYRENWYVDAWCHLRNELRTFHLARIISTSPISADRKVIEQPLLDDHFGQAYGIFAGEAKHIAKLRFAQAVSREIALQHWHPDQIGAWDGREYLLSIPYSDDRELIQDILKHSPNVCVESPEALKSNVKQRLQDALSAYDRG